MENKFNIGDPVQLKIGGAWMMVAEVKGRSALCKWHDAKNNKQEEWYDFAMLKLIDTIEPKQTISWGAI